MITTALPILQAVSSQLGESITDTSTTRMNYLNRAIEFYFSKFPFKFRLKKGSLTTDGSSSYDLISNFSDYDLSFGIYSVENEDGEQLEPIDYSERNLYTNGTETIRYFLTPDNKSIGFTSSSNGDTFYIYYYAEHIDVSSSDETLNVAIPNTHLTPISTIIRAYVYRRKRQRYDERNAWLEFKEELEDAIFSESKEKKIGNFPKIIPPVRKLLGL